MLAQPIGHSQISSQAFYAAELRSERVRIFGVLAFLAAVFVALTVRVFLLHTTVLSPHVAWNVGLTAALGLYEYAMLCLVNRALHKDQEFPRFLWLTSTVLETAVPSIGVAWLTTTDFASAYRPLASPATLLFFVFIILSILRLDPWICRLAGITAAMTYLAAAISLGWVPPRPGTPAPVTQTDVSLYAFILLVSGFIAGGVAGEIRKHVEAALREAETRRQLDRVQHDLRTARDIQRALLPQKPPDLSGFAIAGWNKPADDTGGDFLRLGRYARRPPRGCAWRCDRAWHRSRSARSRVSCLCASELCRSHRSVHRDDADQRSPFARSRSQPFCHLRGSGLLFKHRGTGNLIGRARAAAAVLRA